MNYSTLLQRSVDFDTYAQILYNAYPSQLERPLVLSLIERLLGGPVGRRRSDLQAVRKASI